MFLQVKANLKEVDNASSKIYEKLVPIVGNEKAFIVELVIIETCTNIVKHGCTMENNRIDIKVDIKQRDIEITISDSGKPFNPLKRKLPDLSRIEEFKDGGMGIYLIRSLARKVSYRYVEGKNQLEMLL